MKVNVFGKQMELKKEAVVIAISILVLLGSLAGYIFFRDDSDIIIENSAAAITTGITSETALQIAMEGSQVTGEAIVVKEQIKVYVVGCVKEPGIVTLEKGQLIDDAVRQAGGLTGEADADSINMVYELNENTMLYIKSKKELEQNQGDVATGTVIRNTVAKSTATNSMVVNSSIGNESLGKGAVIVKDSGSSAEVIGNGEGDSEESSNNGKVSNININTADADELDTLPGVGEATARDIIAFREKNGPFRKIEDIMKVPRIKQNRFESIKEFIAVD